LQQRFGYEDNSYQIIFIEEPEAHLHPEVQVKLMEIFAELIKHKIKIVMTSHSNYMFNKINNIILKDDLKTDEIAVYQLIKTPSGSVVNSEMDVSEHGINDANFTDVSKRLYEERVNILED
jgi:predicted ATPase